MKKHFVRLTAVMGLALGIVVANSAVWAAPGPNGKGANGNNNGNNGTPGAPAPTITTISFSVDKAFPGDPVDITGEVKVAGSGEPVGVGKIIIQEYVDPSGKGIPCGTPGGDYINLNGGGTAVNANGQVVVEDFVYPNPAPYDRVGFRAHYVPSGARGDFGQSMSECVDLLDPPTQTYAGLSMGAYGAPNSIATCEALGCNPWNVDAEVADGVGFIPAVGTVFDDLGGISSDANATTIGLHPGVVDGTPDTIRAVTIENLNTLKAYLPAGGTPDRFDPSVITADVHYAAPVEIPDPNCNRKRDSSCEGSNSKGQGAGTLAGQAMTTSLNSFLSGKTGGLQPGGFGSFTVPSDVTALFCTWKFKKEFDASHNVVETPAVCQASRFPACVAGRTVAEVLAAANDHLANGSNGLGCSAGDLATALDIFNTQFDEQGTVIGECTSDPVTILVAPGQGGGTIPGVTLASYAPLSTPGKAEFQGASECPLTP